MHKEVIQRIYNIFKYAVFLRHNADDQIRNTANAS